MAAAAAAAGLPFGPEREAEPAKEARVVGSELVDTYTVCWGRGRPAGGGGGNPESDRRVWGGGLGPQDREEGPAMGPQTGFGEGVCAPKRRPGSGRSAVKGFRGRGAPRGGGPSASIL